MTVAQLREQMPEREFREWGAYYQLEWERSEQARIRARNLAKQGKRG
jgi:hypothetical protein